MFDLSVFEWIVLVIAAMLIGFSKAGVSSMGILVVTLFMILFPAKESVGILLPLLIVGDLFAVTYYRKKCGLEVFVLSSSIRSCRGFNRVLCIELCNK